MILDDSVTYQRAVTSQQAQGGNKYICPHVLIEVKDLVTNQKNVKFIGSGCDAVFQKLESDPNVPNVKQIIKDILTKGAGPDGNSLLQYGWNIEVKEGSPLTITDSSKTVATLHQLDTYLLALYACDNIKYVIWTNGLCWKIWTKDALGKIKKTGISSLGM